MHRYSSYTKILGETNFHAWEIPGSGSKAEDGEKTSTILEQVLQSE